VTARVGARWGPYAQRTPTPIPPHQPNCLGCGDDNPCGMGLRLVSDGDRVSGEVTLDRRHEGAPGYAHGGAIATLLDDALGSLLVMMRVPAVTVNLNVDYRRPALLGRAFAIRGWVERTEGRKLYFAGDLRDGDTVVAEARGLFLKVDVEHFLRGARHAADSDLPRTLPW